MAKYQLRGEENRPRRQQLRGEGVDELRGEETGETGNISRDGVSRGPIACPRAACVVVVLVSLQLFVLLFLHLGLGLLAKKVSKAIKPFKEKVTMDRTLFRAKNWL